MLMRWEKVTQAGKIPLTRRGVSPARNRTPPRIDYPNTVQMKRLRFYCAAA
jgi:hypothetical protein